MCGQTLRGNYCNILFLSSLSLAVIDNRFNELTSISYDNLVRVESPLYQGERVTLISDHTMFWEWRMKSWIHTVFLREYPVPHIQKYDGELANSQHHRFTSKGSFTLKCQRLE